VNAKCHQSEKGHGRLGGTLQVELVRPIVWSIGRSGHFHVAATSLMDPCTYGQTFQSWW
jgi:hypothetical protein